MEKELVVLLKGIEMEGFCFEIVKNCFGILVFLNIFSGCRIDFKFLLKELIVLIGCIYIRLFVELFDEGIDDMFLYLVFDCLENWSIIGVINISVSVILILIISIVIVIIIVDLIDVGDVGILEVSVSLVVILVFNYEGYLI